MRREFAIPNEEWAKKADYIEFLYTDEAKHQKEIEGISYSFTVQRYNYYLNWVRFYKIFLHKRYDFNVTICILEG